MSQKMMRSCNAALFYTKRCKDYRILCNFFSCYKYDVVVIGGGIIGTAIAKCLKETMHYAKIALIEKNCQLGQGQSSHNSQVIHAGIYYRSNSMKAKLCAEGANLIYEYCLAKNIPVRKCGKLIIATNSLDKKRLKVLFERGLENKVSGLELIENWEKVTDIQPNCSGLQALWSPNTGNVDWETVTNCFANDFKNEKGDVFLNCDVNSIKESTDPTFPVAITEITNSKCFLAKFVIICLGLQSGTLLKSDENNYYTNISLKVSYHWLNSRLCRFIKTNIYAMPHLDMPFLGVHFSPTVSGNVLLGPSAVPCLQLDGYTSNNTDFKYVQYHVLSKSFALLFLKNFRSCLSQVSQTYFDKEMFSLKGYFPMLSKNDVYPGPSAVQGQIVTNDGDFVDDFLIDMFQDDGIKKRIVNCRFIPSPGATSSLALARLIVSEVTKRFS